MRHDILNDSFFQNLIRLVALSELLAIISAPPQHFVLVGKR